MKIIIALIFQLISVYCQKSYGIEKIPEDTTEFIEKAGYSAESHLVTTTDGYNLKIYRIPGPPGSQPIFLQHCVFGSSDTWVITGNKSFAFILANMGYDVWMGNYRGNRYSNSHVNMKANEEKFWNFSFHEMGALDLPAMINHVIEATGKKIIYMGYSMGSTGFFVMASEKPEMASKISVAFQLAPVAFIQHTMNPSTKLFAVPVLKLILKTPWITAGILKKSVHGSKVAVRSIVSFSLMKCSFNHYKKSHLPAITREVSGSTSVDTLVHVVQQLDANELVKFDYGPEKNLKIYNQTMPPKYDVSKIKVPIVLMYSNGDTLTVPQDMKHLKSKLPNMYDTHVIDDKNFCHLDFFWGKDAPKLVNKPFFTILKKFEADNIST